MGVLGVGCLVALTFVERRAAEPILPPMLFRNRVFIVTSAVAMVVGFALFGALTYLPLFQQVVRGLSPTASGLQLLPVMGGLLVVLDRLRADHHAHGALQGVADRRHRGRRARACGCSPRSTRRPRRAWPRSTCWCWGWASGW